MNPEYCLQESSEADTSGGRGDALIDELVEAYPVIRAEVERSQNEVDSVHDVRSQVLRRAYDRVSLLSLPDVLELRVAVAASGSDLAGNEDEIDQVFSEILRCLRSW
jgi:hypothetical protein